MPVSQRGAGLGSGHSRARGLLRLVASGRCAGANEDAHALNHTKAFLHICFGLEEYVLDHIDAQGDTEAAARSLCLWCARLCQALVFGASLSRPCTTLTLLPDIDCQMVHAHNPKVPPHPPLANAIDHPRCSVVAAARIPGVRAGGSGAKGRRGREQFGSGSRAVPVAKRRGGDGRARGPTERPGAAPV